MKSPWQFNEKYKADPTTNGKVIYLTQKEFDALLTYSCSLPTGTIEGKRWKRDANWRGRIDGIGEVPVWKMGEYYRTAETLDDHIDIRWRPIIVGEPPPEYVPTPKRVVENEPDFVFDFEVKEKVHWATHASTGASK